MNDAVLAEKLGAISDRLARMEERQIAASARETDVCNRVLALEVRLADMERARWWLAGAAAILASVAGWFARSFTPNSHGGLQ